MRDERIEVAKSVLQRHLEAGLTPNTVKGKIAKAMGIQQAATVDVDEAIKAIYNALEVGHLKTMVSRYDEILVAIDDLGVQALKAIRDNNTDDAKDFILRLLTLSVAIGGGN